MSGRPLAPAPTPYPRPPPPRGCARPPPDAPSPPRLGFAFFWHRLLWGFSPFFGVSSVPLGSRVCVRGNIAIYNVFGGAGAEPWGAGRGTGAAWALPCPGGPRQGTPSPCMSLHPLAFLWTKCGGSGAAGGIWDHTHLLLLPAPPPPAPAHPPDPACPPGVPHVPGPPMSLRGRSPPCSATPTGRGTGLPGPPWSLWPCVPPPTPAACTPTPCQHSDCMSLPLTDGRTDGPVLYPLPSAPYLYPRSVLGVTCRCGSAPSGNVCTRPPSAPETVGDPRPPLGY